MDITRIIESAIGTFTGGLIAVATMWIQNRMREQESVQAWFEQYYVIEGVDRLLSNLTEMEFAIYFMGLGVEVVGVPPILPKEPSPMPVEAAARVESLVGVDLIGPLMIVHPFWVHDLEGELAVERNRHINDLREALFALRSAFFSFKVKKKTDIYKLRDHPEMKAARETFPGLTLKAAPWFQSVTKKLMEADQDEESEEEGDHAGGFETGTPKSHL